LEFTGERMIPGEVEFQLEAEHRSRYAFAARLLPRGRVLDDGCGAGYGSVILARQGLEVVGVDIDDRTVLHCQKRYSVPSLAFQREDSANLSFPDSSFDAVVSFEVVEHVPDYSRYVAEAFRVLRPGGTLLISTPNKRVYSDLPNYRNPFHVHEFYLDEFRQFLGSFFPRVTILGQWNVTGLLIGNPWQTTTAPNSDWLLRTRGTATSEEELLESARYLIAICQKEGAAANPAPPSGHCFVTDICSVPAAALAPAPEIPAAANAPVESLPLSFGKGFYQDEGGWRWMNAEAVLRIPANLTPLRLGFDLTCSSLRFYGRRSFQVHLLNDQERIRSEQFAKDEETRHVDLIIPKQDKEVILRFRSEAYFLPSQCGWPGDQRELAVRFRNLELGDAGGKLKKEGHSGSNGHATQPVSAHQVLPNTNAGQNGKAKVEQPASSGSGFRSVSLELDRIDSLDSFLQHRAKSANAVTEHARIERNLILPGECFGVRGACALCREEVDFAVDYFACVTENGQRLPNWRERLICPRCGLNNRMRAALQVLMALAPSGNAAKIYITEQTTPLFRWLKKRYPETIGSEFLGNSTPRGACRADGIRNEDLTGLSFASESFDGVVTFDVLEHIPEYRKAIRECVRVLRPGGFLLFTVPFDGGSGETVIRARVRADGQIEHLLPPQFHGDPLGGTEGCLCFQIFGWDIIAELRANGFADPAAYYYWSRELAYLGGDQMLFIARKANHPSHKPQTV
jgi:2-polyprenyl-3-methyl-5-hydroxy-6-metoxy-1,4-benzoquinol methylase